MQISGYEFSLKISFTTVLILLLFPFLYLISTLYINGDQTHYHKIYEIFDTRGPLSSSFVTYIAVVGSLEPIHFLTIYILSPILEKNLLFTLINILLLFFATKSIGKITNQSETLILLLLLSSFYINVLFYSAERLKIAFLFFFMGLYFKDYLIRSILFFTLSAISHISIIILFLANSVSLILEKLLRVLKHGLLSYISIIVLALSLAIFIYLFEQIFTKFIDFYNDFSGISSVLQILLLSSLCFIDLKKNRKEYFFVMFAFGIAAFLIGGSRVNMFAYLFTQFHYLKYESIKSPVFLILALYMVYKSTGFFYNVFMYGDAFYQI